MAQTPSGLTLAESPQLWAAIIALFGVVLTLLVNGFLARRAEARRTREEVRRVEADRHHKAELIRAGLRAALAQLVATLDGQIQYARQTGGTVWVPLLDYFSLYKASQTDLGLLSSAEVGALASAYYSYQTELGFAARLADWDIQENELIGASLRVPAEQSHYLVGCLEAAHAAAHHALKALSSPQG